MREISLFPCIAAFIPDKSNDFPSKTDRNSHPCNDIYYRLRLLKSVHVKKFRRERRRTELEMKKIKIPSVGTVQNESATVREVLLGGASPTVVARNTAVGALYALAGFVLGRTPLLFDAFPMGLSFLCAAEKNVLWILVGLAASSFAVSAENTVFSPLAYIVAYVFAYILRFAALIFAERPEGLSIRGFFSRNRRQTLELLLRHRYTESLSLRMASASVSALTIGIYMLRAGDYRYYDLFGALFMILSAPTFAFLYSGFSLDGEAEGITRIMRGISAATLLFSCIYALRGASLLGISLSAFAAFFAVIYLCRRKEKLPFTLFLSLAAGLGVSPAMAPAFMLAAAVLFAVRGGINTSNILLSGGAGLLWGGFAGGVSGVTLLLPAFMTAALAETAVDALKSVLAVKREEKAVSPPAVGAKERLDQLSDTFMALSEKLAELSHARNRPSPVEIRGLCLECANKLCRGCGKYDECHTEKSYSILSERIEEICALLLQKGRAETDDIPTYLADGCRRWEQLVHDTNAAYASLLREAVMRDKIELFALDYEAVSRIIAEAAQSEEEANTRNFSLEEGLNRFSRKNGLGFERIAVYGEKKPRIEIGRIGRVAQEAKTSELRRLMCEACGFPVTRPVFNVSGTDISMSFEAAEQFSAQVGTASEGAVDGVCGDTVSHFKCGRSIYTLISDGMGSGDSAKLASSICGEFLQRMLEGNNRKETAVRMLGTVLRSKGDECSATLDLAELDTVTGELSFLKSGAATSFVRREERLFSLSAKTMPVGIMRGYDGEVTKFTACDGDVAILVSDGVSPVPECCPWLMEMLESGEEFYSDPAAASKAIVAEARRRGSVDDISAAVIKISKVL